MKPVAARWLGAALTALVLLAGCSGPQVMPRTPEQVQADIRGLLPASVPLRDAWAVDLLSVFAALQLDPSPAQVCAVIAITEQESTFLPNSTPGQTEAAARRLADTLGMDAASIRRELERGDGPAFDSSPLLARVVALAERKSGKAQPRARLPVIELKSPKVTRKLNTEWFARRVDERWRRCLQRGAAAAG